MRLHALIGIAWLALAGCYSPELRDCTVTCNGNDECGDEQICATGLCRAPGATCGGSTPSPKVQLRVDVIGEGMVIIDRIGTCSSDGENESSCTWTIAADTQLRLDAQVLDDAQFDRWTTENCAGEGTSCTLTATTATSVGAKFQSSGVQ